MESGGVAGLALLAMHGQIALHERFPAFLGSLPRLIDTLVLLVRHGCVRFSALAHRVQTVGKLGKKDDG